MVWVIATVVIHIITIANQAAFGNLEYLLLVISPIISQQLVI